MLVLKLKLVLVEVDFVILTWPWLNHHQFGHLWPTFTQPSLIWPTLTWLLTCPPPPQPPPDFYEYGWDRTYHQDHRKHDNHHENIVDILILLKSQPHHPDHPHRPHEKGGVNEYRWGLVAPNQYWHWLAQWQLSEYYRLFYSKWGKLPRKERNWAQNPTFLCWSQASRRFWIMDKVLLERRASSGAQVRCDCGNKHWNIFW